MPFACKFCIASKGLKGSEISSLARTQEELAEHIERVHHIVVCRENETQDQAIARFTRTHPNALNCPECREREAPWTTPS